MPTRILLVDDFDFVRAGLRSLFAHRADWQRCGEASDGATAVAKVCELSPDVVILDMSMPIMNGVEAAREIRRVASSTKIILFSLYDVPLQDVSADAFVSKPSGADGLIFTIERLTGQVAKMPISDDGLGKSRSAYSSKQTILPFASSWTNELAGEFLPSSLLAA